MPLAALPTTSMLAFLPACRHPVLPQLVVASQQILLLADFNLSKILQGARPESSLTAGGVTNPMWLVRGQCCKRQLSGR